MTRVVIQRGPTSSSSSQNRGSTSSSTPQLLTPQITLKEEKQEREERVVQDPCALADLLECSGSHNDAENSKNDEFLTESTRNVRNDIAFDEFVDKEKACKDDVIDSGVMTKELSENVGSVVGPSQIVVSISYPPAPPPPPVPPPKPLATNFGLRRAVFSDSNAVRIGSSRRSVAWPVVSTRASPSGLQLSSPGTYGEAEGYNSADEQSPCFGGVTHHDVEKERQFELDIRRTKGLEIRRMVEDGNCLFRAVADQVYGDTEVYDLARQMCIDYMERERNHFSQFLTEGFTSYCKRKRRDKVYGNNMEIQALSEMYNRPIHIYSYSTEPINIFHGSYDTDSPPIRLSYHHGRHYNSLVDPRRSAIGAGLGFSSLHGINVDKDQVKAAIKTQQDQQIDSALLAEGRFYSDMELTEKEIERMVMEASRTEYLAEDKFEHQIGYREYSTSGAEPSSSGARTVSSMTELESERGRTLLPDTAVLSSSSMQMALSMGFSYLQAFEAYSMFGDNVDSIVCYLLEFGSGDAGPENLNRRKGKAAE